MDVQLVIDKYYPRDDELRRIYMIHARNVADLALEFARRIDGNSIDFDFVEEAALLHDIGIFLTDAPRIHCFGSAPYICHGFLGAELMRAEGLPRHALVCERHTGVGLSAELIECQGWPLPARDMLPVSLEEQVICFADKFYSKTKFLESPRTLQQVADSMCKVSDEAVARIWEWARVFGVDG